MFPLACVLLLLASCTYSGGELLYTLGFGQPGKVKAQFRLTSGPLLILIDDPARMLDWPPAEAYLFDHLSQELLRHKAAAKIVPLETVQHLRQSTPDFARRGAREVGEMVGAEQVLLLTVAAYRGEEQIGDVSEAGLFSVTVKVINVLEKDDPLRVRLWPESPRGKRVDAV
ncbi:MAG: hypothetical protein D6788_11485, partial [Planctomycetota bacterium]